MSSTVETAFSVMLFSFFQYPALPDYYKFILVTVVIVMTLIEAIRLYLGYAGNLQEKVRYLTEQAVN